MTTPSRYDAFSSPFIGVVPRTPAVYHRYPFSLESPVAAVPQLQTHGKSPHLDPDIIQLVPKTPATATPATDRGPHGLLHILQAAGESPRRTATDTLSVLGSQVVPSGFSPFLQSQTEKLSQLNRKDKDSEDSDTQETDAYTSHISRKQKYKNKERTSSKGDPSDHHSNRPCKVRFTSNQQGEVKQLNLFDEQEDIFAR